MNTMLCDGYLAEIEFDEEANLIKGTVVNAQRPFKFSSETLAGLRTAFEEAIRGYLSGPLELAFPAVVEMSAEHHQRMCRSATLTGRNCPSGAPGYQCLQQAYDEWLEALYVAFGEYRSKGDFGRTGAELACIATVRFLAKRWENPELTVPFTALSLALKDIREEQKPELFFDKKEPIRRPRSSFGRHLTMWPAALLHADFLFNREQADTVSLNQSAGKIARGVQNWACMASFKVTSTTVKNWRSDWRAKPANERGPFEAMVDGLLAGPDPAKAIKTFLRSGPPDAPGTPKT